MGISDEARAGTSVGAGVSVVGGIGGGGALETSNPVKSMSVLMLSAELLPAARREKPEKMARVVPKARADARKPASEHLLPSHKMSTSSETAIQGMA